jgi:hypothetical protein
MEGTRVGFRGQRFEKTESEDSGLRGQKTDELAALSRRVRWKNPALGFRGQIFEKTEDR